MKVNDLNGVIDNILSEEIRRYIIENTAKKQVFHIKCDGEPIDTFENEQEANDNLDKYKKAHPEKELIIEPSEYESYDDMIEKLGEMGEGINVKEETKTMKNKINESKSKKTIVVSETQMKTIIGSLISENVPGIEVTKRAQDQTKKDASANTKEVEAKLKKASRFDGNDNPEFPHQIGGEKKAYRNTEKEDEFVEDTRGGGMQDIKFENDPPKQFKDRQKSYLEGDSKTGNSQDAANVVKSDLGKKMAANATRKEKKVKEFPMYVKDPQPVKVVKEEISEVVNDDIKRMKDIFSYNKKTQ